MKTFQRSRRMHPIHWKHSFVPGHNLQNECFAITSWQAATWQREVQCPVFVCLVTIIESSPIDHASAPEPLKCSDALYVSAFRLPIIISYHITSYQLSSYYHILAIESHFNIWWTKWCLQPVHGNPGNGLGTRRRSSRSLYTRLGPSRSWRPGRRPAWTTTLQSSRRKCSENPLIHWSVSKFFRGADPPGVGRRCSNGLETPETLATRPIHRYVDICRVIDACYIILGWLYWTTCQGFMLCTKYI